MEKLIVLARCHFSSPKLIVSDIYMQTSYGRRPSVTDFPRKTKIDLLLSGAVSSSSRKQLFVEPLKRTDLVKEHSPLLQSELQLVWDTLFKH